MTVSHQSDIINMDFAVVFCNSNMYIGDFYAKYSIYTEKQTQIKIQNTEHQQLPKPIEAEKLLNTPNK